MLIDGRQLMCYRLTSSTIPAKRGREASPGPSSSTTPLFVEDLGGQDILMVAAKLPPLPELPIDVAHLPYITNDDHQCEANPTELVAGRRTQQRQELVGDSVAKVFVTHWVVEQHPDLKASSASVSQAADTAVVVTQYAQRIIDCRKFVVHY